MKNDVLVEELKGREAALQGVELQGVKLLYYGGAPPQTAPAAASGGSGMWLKTKLGSVPP